MRTLSAAVVAQFYKQQGGYAVPALVEITHGPMSTKLYGLLWMSSKNIVILPG